MRRKNDETTGNGDGHIKFRVIEFEIDGGNATLAEGIKALTTALSKTPVTTTAISQRALPAATPKRTAVTEAHAPAEGELFPETDEPENTEEEHQEETNGNAAPARAKRGTGAPPPTPEVLSDIDLNAGKVSLKDYMEQKSPPDTYERFVTIAVWYKENHNLGEVNADRIYTAYRFLDLPSPNDVGQTLRNLKAKKKWFDKGDERGGYKVNILGLNKVHAAFK
jgi:hypothetical protein